MVWNNTFILDLAYYSVELSRHLVFSLLPTISIVVMEGVLG